MLVDFIVQKYAKSEEVEFIAELNKVNYRKYFRKRLIYNSILETEKV